MFDSIISQIEIEIEMLKQKKDNLSQIVNLSSSVMEDIKQVIGILNEYPNEKNTFISKILDLLGINPGDNVSSYEPPKQEEIEVEYPKHELHKPFVYGSSICVWFANLKSKNGTNSLKTWEKELKQSFSQLSFLVHKGDDSEFDGKYLMIVDGADESVSDYVMRLDFSSRPGEYPEIVDETPVIEQESIEIEETPEVNEEIETETIQPPKSTKTLTKLDVNKRVATYVTHEVYEMYIGFDRDGGFADQSNRQLWKNYIESTYQNVFNVENVDNWEDSNLNGYLLKVTTRDITKFTILTAFNYEETPVINSYKTNSEPEEELVAIDASSDDDFMKSIEDGLRELEMLDDSIQLDDEIELGVPETKPETPQYEPLDFDPDADFEVI